VLEWTAVLDLYVELRRIAEALDAGGVAYAGWFAFKFRDRARKLRSDVPVSIRNAKGGTG